MKNFTCLVLLLIVTGCANLQTPEETNIAVSSLLDEIQIAINEIDSQTKGSSLPPFKSAIVKLSTKATISSAAGASLFLSGKKESSTTNSNTITLELVPNPNNLKSMTKSTGKDIAGYVIAAVRAVDKKNYLKLNTLTIEAGLQVIRTSSGGIEIELVGISIEGGKTGETSNLHNLTLSFEMPKKA
jgi:hypothetical protein